MYEYPERINYRKIALRLIVGAVAVWGLLSLIGLVVKHFFVYGRIGAWDRGVEIWFVAHRHHSLNTLTSYANHLGSTGGVIVITGVLILVFRWKFGRWNESVVLLVDMVGEVTIFIAVTLTVHRIRPHVIELDKSPPTSSYPSGHTAAAVALYGGIAVLLIYVYGINWKTRLSTCVLLILPILVAISRLYRGMHFPVDVIAGAIGGGLWMSITMITLRPVLARESKYRKMEVR